MSTAAAHIQKFNLQDEDIIEHYIVSKIRLENIIEETNGSGNVRIENIKESDGSGNVRLVKIEESNGSGNVRLENVEGVVITEECVAITENPVGLIPETIMDLLQYDPWALPENAKIGSNEWYFFTLLDKTPTDRKPATGTSYWEATGEEHEVKTSSEDLVGLMKTLVFHKVEVTEDTDEKIYDVKTNWTMHEFRVKGEFPARLLTSLNIPENDRGLQNKWAVCRVFEKSDGGEKSPVDGDFIFNTFTSEDFRAASDLEYEALLKADGISARELEEHLIGPPPLVRMSRR